MCAFYHTSIKILHKDAFGYALSYLSKRQDQLFQYDRQIQDGRHYYDVQGVVWS